MRRAGPANPSAAPGSAVLIVIDMGSGDVLTIVCYFTTAAGRVCQPHEPQLHAQLPGGGHGLRRAPHNRGVHAACTSAPAKELTFDYASVTESEKEFRTAICLCGTRNCRGSFLTFAGSRAFQQVQGLRCCPSMPLHRSSTSMRALECCSSAEC